MYKFKFADIGEGLHEGVVGEVYKKVGDTVKEGDSLFSVETDKVTSDIPSPVSGTVTEVRVKTGEVVHVGDDVFHFDTGEGGATSEDASSSLDQKEEKEEDGGGGGASVVGEVKVSNSLLSFGSFGSSSSKPATPSKPAVAKAEQPKPQIMPTAPSFTQSTSEGFDINNIKPVGNGEQVDIVVIGAGPGGYTAAEFLAKEGFKTVVIEKQFAGGVCLNIGCIPTKTLLKSAKVFEEMKKSKEFGIDIDASSLSLNWNKMKQRKDQASEKLRNGVKMLLRAARAELIEGEAKIIDQYNVEVNGRKLTTKVIILATGSSPIVLPLPGFKEGYQKGIMIDSTAALNLKTIPKNLTVIGGGVIGMEFAMLYQELGSKVTILEGTDSILGQMDNQVKQEALKILADKKIVVKTNAFVKEYKAGAIVYEQDGKKVNLKAEKVLVSVGRKPNNLGLDQSLGLKVGKRGEFIVNENFQTSMSNIFAIGDCNAEIMLAHVAYRQAHVVRSLIAKKRKQVFNPKRVPSCVYTHPEISSVGYTEEELKKMGVDYIKSVWQNQNVGRVISDGAGTFGFAKLLVKKDSGEILGAHIINNNSSDMITEIISIMELEGTVFELANTVHPHPSIAEAIYEAAVHAVTMIEKQN